MPKPKLVDDPEQVTDTLKSLEIAEGIVGSKLPDPTSKEEQAKVAPTAEYHLADSDEEENDTGDSTLETRRSVRTVENNLKKRWFINAGEKKDFEARKANG